MRRPALIAAAGLGLIALCVLGYALFVVYKGQDVKGSSTVEFVPTATPKPVVAPPPRARRSSGRPTATTTSASGRPR